jgi:hypothetical protein
MSGIGAYFYWQLAGMRVSMFLQTECKRLTSSKFYLDLFFVFFPPQSIRLRCEYSKAPRALGNDFIPANMFAVIVHCC